MMIEERLNVNQYRDPLGFPLVHSSLVAKLPPKLQLSHFLDESYSHMDAEIYRRSDEIKLRQKQLGDSL
jgi:hypothetical protein